MKETLKKIISIRTLLLLTLLSYVIYRQAPVLIENYHKKGQKVTPYQVKSLIEKDKYIYLPIEDRKSVLFYWVSWCGPCHLEMNRLQRAIAKGEIEANKIFAINPFENKDQILNFLEDNHYDFQFYLSNPLIDEQLDIKGTPTILSFNGFEIEHAQTGVSPFSVWRAKSFLNSN